MRKRKPLLLERLTIILFLILKKIDLIDYFHVKEFNNTNALINIKFYGKINKIREKLLQNNLNLYQADSQWNITIEK